MRKLLFILFALLTLPALAQEEKKHVREGNKSLRSKEIL